jgi:hypothetical protein
MTARGVRNNNPGNLRHGPNWQGLSPTQPDSAFSTFVDMEHGIRALLKNLRTYVQTHNLQTVRQIISRWAPKFENEFQENYIRGVAQDLGVDPDQKIVGDFGQLLGIAKAIARHENGKDADLITRDQWNRGFELAFGEPEEITVPKLGPIVPIKPITEHQTMPIAPILAAVLPTFLEAAPKLIRIFGDGKQSDKNARAAQIVADIAKEATGATNEQAAAEVISRDPKAAEAFQTAVQERWFELTEVGGGIPEARKFMDKMTGEGPQWRQIGYSVMVAVLAFLIVGGGGYVLASIALDSGEDPQLRAGIVEYAKNIGLIVAGFVFGSSVTSRQKDQALLERR